MATRHNTCDNPCLSNDAAGWGGGVSPTRTAVTGFDRPFAARYTSGTFSNSARGAVSGGSQVTISQYVRLATAAPTVTGTLFLEWRDAATNVITYGSAGYTVPGGQVARQSATVTAPANAAFLSIISEGFNFGTGNGDFSQVLIEDGPDLLDYFDGDTAGASWDGTPGSSASTLEDDLIAGTFHAVLPPLTGAFVGEVTVEGVFAGVLPALTASFAGHSDAVDGVAQLSATAEPAAAMTPGAAPLATIRTT